jgi:hypothetical protein
MAEALNQVDYQVYNLSYPSRRAPIENLADIIGTQIWELQLDPSIKINFVTHSLGGIVLRYLLKDETILNIGRVVMLAPPNRGADLVDALGWLPFYDWILGPVGSQIGTGADSIPNTLGLVNYEVGVIAGNRSCNPLFSALIPGPDDGRIAVEHTRLVGMKDFLILPCIHALIMNDKQVIQQTIHFIKHGCFIHFKIA